MSNREVFFDAYVTCALWSSSDDTPENEPFDENYGPEDIALESREEMAKECADFQEANRELLEKAYNEKRGYDEAQAGHDFWLTRNGHGAGFWDRGLGEIGAALTKASESYGSVDLYLGDDGKVYCS